MLISLLFGIPLWAMILGYLLLGLLWALGYGHYRLLQNAKTYAIWRLAYAKLLEGSEEDVKDFMAKRKKACAGHLFFDKVDFMIRLGLYFSGWPLSMVIALVMDILIPFVRKLWKILTNLHRYIRQALSALYRVLTPCFSFVIARENREAIADMAVINKDKEAKS